MFRIALRWMFWIPLQWMFRIPLHWQILCGMIVGAGIGLALNATCGRRTTRLPDEKLPVGVSRLEIFDSTDQIVITVVDAEEREKQYVVDGTSSVPGVFATLEKLKESRPDVYEWFHAHGRSTARKFGAWKYKI